MRAEPEHVDLALSPEIARMRRLAIVPAFNEQDSVGSVIDEIHAFDPGFEIAVVDDGSSDRTSEIARSRGVHVLTLPFNLGIGAAMQTGYRFAIANDFDIAVQIDGDGQHDPTELPALLAPLLADDADLVVGSRFCGEGAFRSSFTRRLGIHIFAWTVSAIAHQRLTDTTSGFRAVNRRGIALFAMNYPHDYPEVEATVMLVKTPPPCERGSDPDARTYGRPLLDHRSSLHLLHGQGLARTAR